MDKEYEQLTLREGKEIEEGPDRGDSFRAIARLTGRNPSTISREVRENRHVRSFKARKAACRDRSRCKRAGVCAERVREGAHCSGCDARDCRDECKAHAGQAGCDRMSKAPWVCNGRRKNRYGCNRANRCVYDAEAAQKASDERRSESRKGIDMDPERAEVALPYIKDGESRGLSPYEISVLYGDVVGVGQSTIYRGTDAGYGGLAHIELERKVGFEPRRKRAARKSAPRSKKRSHDEFDKLPDELEDARTELGSAIGRNADRQAALTLHSLPCHVQPALLVAAHDCGSVKKALGDAKPVMPGRMFAEWMRVGLTDNGDELADEDGIGEILGERVVGGEPETRLCYCDPRQSQQKAGCEKNRTEIRRLLEKGMFVFDELAPADMAVPMSHVDSNPRAALGGKPPIQMLRFVYGGDADDLLDALGIHEVGRDEPMLKPEVLDIERAKRGEPPLTRLK